LDEQEAELERLWKRHVSPDSAAKTLLRLRGSALRERDAYRVRSDEPSGAQAELGAPVSARDIHVGDYVMTRPTRGVGGTIEGTVTAKGRVNVTIKTEVRFSPTGPWHTQFHKVPRSRLGYVKRGETIHPVEHDSTSELAEREENPEGEGEESWIAIDEGAEGSEAPFLAQHWYAGQGDPLYAIASAGFPQPESTVEWALRNAERSSREHDVHMVKKYGKRGYQNLLRIDPQSQAARKLPKEKREDLEASEEIFMLVHELEEVLKHGRRISSAEGWAAHGRR
jgi:hypothetical protein